MKYKLLVTLIVVLFAIRIVGQVDRSKMPEAAPAPDIEIGNYESFQLANGLNVIVVENHKLPRVAFQLIIDRDPILEEDNAGYINTAGSLLGTATGATSSLLVEVGGLSSSSRRSSSFLYFPKTLII